MATISKPRCPRCNSGEVYFRRILQNFACRKCGHTFPNHGEALQDQKQ